MVHYPKIATILPLGIPPGEPVPNWPLLYWKRGWKCNYRSKRKFFGVAECCRPRGSTCPVGSNHDGGPQSRLSNGHGDGVRIFL